jgi:hypothetical protein
LKIVLACLLALSFTVVCIKVLTPKSDAPIANQVRVVTDHGVALASFFDGLTEVALRLRPPSQVARTSALIRGSSLFHFLGLSPLEVRAQTDNCNGSRQRAMLVLSPVAPSLQAAEAEVARAHRKPAAVKTDATVPS